MATKRPIKAIKASKNRSKRVPSVKRLNGVRTLTVKTVAICATSMG
jgi:hypothetical protein